MSKKENTQPLSEKKDDNSQVPTQSNTVTLPAFISLESTLGAFSILASRSRTHKHLFTADYEWLVIPPISLKQFALFRNKKNEPIAFVSWANVNEDVEERLNSGVNKLQPQDWNSGKKTYIIDILSPFAPSKEVLKQLNDDKFKDQKVNILTPKKNGDGVDVKSLNDFLFNK